jgi:hypothetical protein
LRLCAFAGDFFFPHSELFSRKAQRRKETQKELKKRLSNLYSQTRENAPVRHF